MSYEYTFIKNKRLIEILLFTFRNLEQSSKSLYGFDFEVEINFLKFTFTSKYYRFYFNSDDANV